MMFTKKLAVGRGLLAALLVACVLDQGGAIMRGFVGALAAVAILVVLAPPRMVEVLRAELRAPHVQGGLGKASGIPIGPALAYALIVLSVPFMIWTTLIIGRAITAGVVVVDVPWSAFAAAMAVCLTLAVEGLRARRTVAG